MRSQFFNILALFIMLPGLAFAEPVVFDGVPNSVIQKLKKKNPSLFTSTPTMATLNELTKLLMKENVFEQVEVLQNPGTNGFVVSATSIRRIQDIRVQGNQQISKDRILKVIQLKTNQLFDRRTILKVGERLKQYYSDNGFFNAIIEVVFKKQQNGKLDIIFKVTEGIPCRVQNIQIFSPNKSLNESLERLSKKTTGRIFSVEGIQNVRNELNTTLGKKRYLSATISDPKVDYNSEKSQAIISFEILDPYKYQIFFHGLKNSNRAFYRKGSSFKYQETHSSQRKIPTEQQIRRSIKFEKKQSSQVDPASEISFSIRKYFLESGFPSVQVKLKKAENKKTFSRILNYNIETGPQVKIANWKINGRYSRAPKYYINFIEDNSGKIIQQGYYNADLIEKGQKNLLIELRNQGFLMAKVQSTRVEYLGKEKSNAVVTINLDEGPLTQVRRLQFIDNKAFSNRELSELFITKSNSPLRLKQLEESIEKLKLHYLNNGYLEMKLLNDSKDIVRYNKQGTQANITIRIYEGPKIYVKTIVVEGNGKTKEEVIKKALSFKEGDVLTPEHVGDSSLALNRMGIFSRVNIETMEPGSNISRRTILVSVTERDPGLLRFGTGVNNERELTARGFLGLSYSNIAGTARGVSGRIEVSSNIADINYLEHKATVGYLEPFVFGTQTKARFNLTRSDEVFSTTKVDDENLVTILKQNKFAIVLERDLSRNIKFGWNLWSINSRTTHELKYRDSTDPSLFDPEETQQVALIGPVLDFDYRDNPFTPRKGFFSRVGVDYSAPALGSSTGIEFAKVDSVYRYYQPFHRPKFVWANELRLGYLSNLSDYGKNDLDKSNDSGVPASYMFLLGSHSALRGYDLTDEKNRVPRGTGDTEFDHLEFDDANSKVVKSDSYYYLIKTEIRYPIFDEFADFAVFYDGGAVLVSGYDFKDPYRDAIGFGIRINTPVGPLSLDMGFKLDPKKGEDLNRFHFSIGTF